MSRYIDAEEALQIFKKRVESFQSWLANITEENLKHNVNGVIEGWRGAIDMLERKPAADVEEVRHGKWIFGVTMNHEWMTCSECLVSQTPTGVFVYCPNCGAKMDGGTQ